MNIKPLADRVLVNPCPAEEVTVAGIIIPDSAKEKPLKGVVLAAGNGTKDEEMVVKEGDTVLVRLDALPEVAFEGCIADIGLFCHPKDYNKPRQKVFDVEVRLLVSDERLKPGMTVSCEFLPNNNI